MTTYKITTDGLLFTLTRNVNGQESLVGKYRNRHAAVQAQRDDYRMAEFIEAHNAEAAAITEAFVEVASDLEGALDIDTKNVLRENSKNVYGVRGSNGRMIRITVEV